MKNKIIIGLLTLAAAFAGCGNTVVENPLFSGTTLIESVNYVSLNSTFYWDSPAVSYQVVGIFTNDIAVQNGQILNTNDCVGLWNTALVGSAGNVGIANFVSVTNGVITTNLLTALPSGSKCWAVWGYDEGGTVTHSSCQTNF